MAVDKTASTASTSPMQRQASTVTKRSTRDDQSPVLKKLAQLEGKLHQRTDERSVPFIKTAKADTVFGVVILLNAAFIGVDIEFSSDAGFWPFWVVESIFLVIFSVEICMRLAGEYPHLCRFFDAWGSFDTFVTVMGILDIWVLTFVMGNSEDNPMSSFSVLRMLRLFRLVRLVRVLRMFNELVVLVKTIADSMRAVAWMSLLLGMIIYTGAVMTVMLIGIPYRESDPDVALHFGSLGAALFSHFCVVTLEAWPDIAMAAIKQNSLWALYFVAMIVLTNFALLNLMVGVIVERIIHVSMEQENELASFVAESQQFRVTLRALFDSADMDASGTVSRREIRYLLEDPRTHEIMSAFGINLNIPPSTLHTIMNVSGDGETTFEEFFHACMRLCGSKQNVHSVFVQGDICGVQRELVTRLSAIEERFERYADRHGDATSSQRMRRMTSSHSVSEGMPAGASLEGAMSELLDRLDRVTQTQQYMFAEIHALKECAALQRDGPGPPFDASLADVGPMLLHKAGRELGACCMDSLFSQRRVGGVASPPTSRRARSAAGTSPPASAEFREAAGGPSSSSGRGREGRELQRLTRQGLEAEFRSKGGR